MRLDVMWKAEAESGVRAAESGQKIRRVGAAGGEGGSQNWCDGRGERLKGNGEAGALI